MTKITTHKFTVVPFSELPRGQAFAWTDNRNPSMMRNGLKISDTGWVALDSLDIETPKIYDIVADKGRFTHVIPMKITEIECSAF